MFQSPLSRGTTSDIYASMPCVGFDKFQSPLSRGTTSDRRKPQAWSNRDLVSIPSKSGHYFRLKNYFLCVPPTMFQSPLSRGTTSDLGLSAKRKRSGPKVSIPSKSGHYFRLRHVRAVTVALFNKFQSPLSRGTTSDPDPEQALQQWVKVSIPSKSGHYFRYGGL